MGLCKNGPHFTDSKGGDWGSPKFGNLHRIRQMDISMWLSVYKNGPRFTDSEGNEFKSPNVQEFTKTQTKRYPAPPESVWKRATLHRLKRSRLNIAQVQKFTQTQTKEYSPLGESLLKTGHILLTK